MRATVLLLLLLLCLLPAAALAQDDDEDDGEEGIVTEVEGTGNKVIVIEELVINIDTGDVTASSEGGEALGLVHRLLDMLGGGPGPELMGQPRMPHPGGPGMGPDGFFAPFHPRMNDGPRTEVGPPGRRQWSEQRSLRHGERQMHGEGQMRHGDGPMRGDGPRVSDNVRGMMPGAPGMKHPGPGMMQGGPGMPGMPGLANPEFEADPEFRELMLQLAKLAWSDPQFREHLRAFVMEYSQAAEHGGGPGPHHGAR